MTDWGNICRTVLVGLTLQDLILRIIALNESENGETLWRETGFCRAWGPFLLYSLSVVLVAGGSSVYFRAGKSYFWVVLFVGAVLIISVGNIGTVVLACSSSGEISGAGFNTYTLLSLIIALSVFGFSLYGFRTDPDLIKLLVASICFQQSVWKLTDLIKPGILCGWAGMPAVALLLLDGGFSALWAWSKGNKVLITFLGVVTADFALTRTGHGIIMCQGRSVKYVKVSYSVAVIIEVAILGFMVWWEKSEYRQKAHLQYRADGTTVERSGATTSEGGRGRETGLQQDTRLQEMSPIQHMSSDGTVFEREGGTLPASTLQGHVTNEIGITPEQ